MTPEPRHSVIVSFSGGKDSHLLIWKLKEMGYSIAALFCTIERETGCSKFHGVSRQMTQLQADRMGLPIHWMEVPTYADNTVYERDLLNLLEALGFLYGTRTVAFGDLFLEPIRNWRDQLLGRHGFQPIYPLWHTPSLEIAERFWSLRGAATIVCADLAVMPTGTAGQKYTPAFVAGLSEGIDPAGENGEFHTYVCDFELYSSPISTLVTERRQQRYVGSVPALHEIATLSLA